MSNPENSVKFCLFCYKTVTASSSLQYSSNKIKNFAKLYNRFARRHKVNPLNTKFNAKELLDYCSGCEDILNNFCGIYCQLETLELKLVYSLTKLVDKIIFANQVPARWIHVNKVLEEIFPNDLDKKEENQNIIRKFRQNLVDLRDHRKLLYEPRVSLTRTESMTPSWKPSCLAAAIEVPTSQTTVNGNKGNLSFRNGYRKNVCPECRKIFKTRKDLTSHLETHLNGKGVETDLKQNWINKPIQDRKGLHSNNAFVEPNIQSQIQQPHSYGRRKKPLAENSNIEETGSPKNSQHLTEDMPANLSRYENTVEIESTTFPMDDYESQYDDMPKLDDYSGKNNDDVVQEVFETNKMEIIDDTPTFKDPLIQVKEEHYLIVENIEMEITADDNSDRRRTLTSKGGRPKARQNHARKLCKRIKQNREQTCPQCGKKLSSKSTLAVHLEFHKDPKDWKWECEKCGKKFPREQALQEHIKKHTRVKPYGCQLCGERFGYNVSLKKHLNDKHYNVKEVENGPRTLKSKGGRRKLVENNAGGFQCEECGNKVSSRTALRIHMEFHKDPKDWQFKCDKCGRKFARGQALKEHVKTHSRDRPFGCRFCGESYRVKRSLIKHLSSKHAEENKIGEEIIKCSKIGFKESNKRNMDV